MTDDDLKAIADACRRECDAATHADGRTLSILQALRRAAARPLPPGDAPVPERRLEEIRAAVADVWPALGTDPAVERDGRDLLAALDFERKRADHCESAMADLLAESDRYALGHAEGVARALEVIGRYVASLPNGPRTSAGAYHLGLVAARLADACGPAAPPLPCLASLARMRRLEAALQFIVSAFRPGAGIRTDRIHAAARAALEARG